MKKLLSSLWTAPLATILIVAGGCGPSVSPDSDPGEALTVLRAGLEAWKKGETAEALQNQQPPIWFNEQDYRGGAKLLDYKLDEKSAMFGRQVRFEVHLTTEKNGRRSERTIAYLVDTTPNRVIAREGL